MFVALPADNDLTMPIFETVLNGIAVIGSIVGTRKDLREVSALDAAGRALGGHERSDRSSSRPAE